MGAHVRPQGAARARQRPRSDRARGPHRARVHAEGRRARDRPRARLGRRERRVGPRPRRRRARRRRRVRGRGADAEAVARPRARPREPDPQAHVPHHDRRRAESPTSGSRAAEGREAAGRGGAGARDPEPKTQPTVEEKPKAPSRLRKKKEAVAANGPEGASRRSSRRRHPRLEVQLVDRQEGDRRLPARGHQDPRPHQRQARACRVVGHPDPQGQAAGDGRHLHRAPRDRDREVRGRGGRAPQGPPRHHRQERPHQHQRDQAARARRAARRAVDRGAAPEPRRVPARDEALPRVGDAVGRAGHQDPVRRAARRRRDEPQRALHRGPRPAAHDPGRHRLRLRRGEDHVRPDRRQGLGQQGRDHARGLRRLARSRAHHRGGRLTPATRLEQRGARRLPRGRSRPGTGPRGPRARPEAPAPGGRGRGGQARGPARERAAAPETQAPPVDEAPPRRQRDRAGDETETPKTTPETPPESREVGS